MPSALPHPGSPGPLGPPPVSLEHELRSSFLAYAMSTLISRNVPDVRDGLKPVQRRILYAMHEQKLTHASPYRKSARVVGDVLGKYHPHGDQSVYDALVRMAQPFSLRYPLVDGQGNFGSIDRDPAAAMRYTEARLTRFAGELLADIEAATVDFVPNYDDSAEEPSVLPSRVPHLLLNGTSGIAVGMTSEIPPHNLREIVDATVRLIRNPRLELEDLLRDDPESGRLGIRGPDLPTGGIVHGTVGFRRAYATGSGSLTVRARAHVEPVPGKADRKQIVVTELPFQVCKAEIVREIAKDVREKRLEGIADIRDESDRSGVRVVIELRRDEDPDVVLAHLYRSHLQRRVGLQFIAIVDGKPQQLTLRRMLELFIAHRRDVVTRRTRHQLEEARRQIEIVEGQGMAATDTDRVIATIRAAADQEAARRALMELPLRGLEEFVRRAGRPEAEIEAARARTDYRLSERQAQAILDMRLGRLAALERDRLAAQYGELRERILRLEAILASESRLLDVIVEELDEVRVRYGDDRRTEIVEQEDEVLDLELVRDEDVVVTLTRAGYLKRTRLDEYRAQGRGGRGVRGIDARDEDVVTSLLAARTRDHVLFLTNRGRVYVRRVYEIPEAERAARGRAVVNLLDLQPEERLAAVVTVRDFSATRYLVTCTRGGTVKRTKLSAYANVRSTGIIAVQIEEGDELLFARIAEESDEVMCGTAQGHSIRFRLSEVRATGRGTVGVYGMNLRDGDRIVGFDVITDPSMQVLTVSAHGFGKRTPIAEWRVQKRAGSGVIAMDTSERNGEMVALRLVRPDDHVMVLTDGGQVIRIRVSDVREVGRNAQGVRIIRLDDGERVVDVAPIRAEDDDGEAAPLPAQDDEGDVEGRSA
ncbi:MAG: DNA gyrase subunit A [Myxococcota bacterium]|nr:DNA gyrase subunit A [Myxococcota bacterium]MDW8362035.1 DNA gyrase subunit A [Myxococcales bacterium]